ncbi:transcriptional regulator [Pseudomonas alliivorans]|nr:transcriptional regulator [Pseudomonas alliivorans]MEE4710621.1 transcriptional regulator [Pseudomonas alliivorans]MEE4724772.1 transcriptional regulator [Pseudomonas alliivorans]MEE4766367.1 transcriptional regulator [Pseudomonas alliivorans]MEE5154715.1 transcriptional regulator [Pseudomonas alliivorans]
MKDRPHDEVMAEQFHADPDYASELLIEVHRHGDTAELAILLRQMDKAFGQDEEGSLADAERKQSST